VQKPQLSRTWCGGWEVRDVECGGSDEPPNKKVDSVRVEEFLSDHGPEGAAKGAESLKVAADDM
jgi:hypothetical protein